ncbi:serine/arginine-rich splicing factor SR45-like [Octodon degus]|uniref:Serine/arginine-rich splicing factor SR45-like n=1 Tax=Octodon degus TaxID=10160 RepID=A0A6P3VE12_OCTDE|nr:serine/arginine-rich splicing factor SR45-like [Octodon degus]
MRRRACPAGWRLAAPCLRGGARQALRGPSGRVSPREAEPPGRCGDLRPTSPCRARPGVPELPTSDVGYWTAEGLKASRRRPSAHARAGLPPPERDRGRPPPPERDRGRPPPPERDKSRPEPSADSGSSWFCGLSRSHGRFFWESSFEKDGFIVAHIVFAEVTPPSSMTKSTNLGLGQPSVTTKTEATRRRKIKLYHQDSAVKGAFSFCSKAGRLERLLPRPGCPEPPGPSTHAQLPPARAPPPAAAPPPQRSAKKQMSRWDSLEAPSARESPPERSGQPGWRRLGPERGRERARPEAAKPASVPGEATFQDSGSAGCRRSGLPGHRGALGLQQSAWCNLPPSGLHAASQRGAGLGPGLLLPREAPKPFWPGAACSKSPRVASSTSCGSCALQRPRRAIPRPGLPAPRGLGLGSVLSRSGCHSAGSGQRTPERAHSARASGRVAGTRTRGLFGEPARVNSSSDGRTDGRTDRWTRKCLQGQVQTCTFWSLEPGSWSSGFLLARRLLNQSHRCYSGFVHIYSCSRDIRAMTNLPQYA